MENSLIFNMPKFTSQFFVFIWLLICGLGFSTIQAQVALTLDRAIAIAMDSNFDIKLADNQVEIRKILNHPGEAGFLPSINGSLFFDRHFDTEREYLDQTKLDTEFYRELQEGAAVELNWTLFDGLRMFTRRNQLEKFEKLGHLEAAFVVESVVSSVIVAYYTIVSLEKRVQVLENSLETSEQRKEIARTKFSLGSGSEYDFLLAETDLNSDKATLVREKRLLNEAKMELINILKLEAATEISVSDQIELGQIPDFFELKNMIAEQNTSLSIARLNNSISELQLKEVKQSAFPTIRAHSAYYFNDNRVRTSTVERHQVNGFYAGLSASFNIFDGFHNRRQRQVSQINVENSYLQYENAKLELEVALRLSYDNFLNSLERIELEENNLELAQRTLSIALDRFELGTISSVEFRESQQALLNIENRLIEALLEAKLFETDLLLFSGQLLTERDR